MKKLILLPLLLLFTTFSWAQEEEVPEDPNNMVIDGHFSNFDGKLKKLGQFDLLKDWNAGTENMPDLYARDIKSDYVAIPRNAYGEQEPALGNSYVGITAYGYRGREPRTYISSRLKTDMVKDQMYCIKFRASLSELSKYAVNNIGVHFTKHEMDVKTDGSLIFDDFIVSESNEVIDQMDGWYLYCKIIRAKGFERYLTIGNFAPDDKTNAQKVKRPAGYTEMQKNMAYYYIDDVSIKHIQYPGECDCSEGRIPESKIIYSKSATSADGKTLSEKVEASTIYFYQFKPEVSSSFERDLDNLVSILKENGLVKLRIISHIDNEEAAMGVENPRMADLCNERALEVLRYFQKAGIDRNRLKIDLRENNEPEAEMNTPLSLAKNRRVEFQITK